MIKKFKYSSLEEQLGVVLVALTLVLTTFGGGFALVLFAEAAPSISSHAVSCDCSAPAVHRFSF